MILDLDYVFEKYKPNVSGIIHIGGHYGNEIQKYKNHNVNKITLFEPLSSNFSILKKNIDDKYNLSANLKLIITIIIVSLTILNDHQLIINNVSFTFNQQGINLGWYSKIGRAHV